MKRLLCLLLLFCLPSLAEARMSLMVSGSSLGQCGSTCTAGCLLFSWDCSSVDVTSGGCSLGDTSATLVNEASLAGGAVTITDGSANGADYYRLDETSFATFPSGAFTIQMDVNLTTLTNNDARLFTMYITSTNVFAIRLVQTTGNDIRFYHYGNGVLTDKTFDCNLSLSTAYTLIIKASPTRGMQLKVDGTTYTDATKLITPMVHDGGSYMDIGNTTSGPLTGTIDNVKVFYGWRDDI